MITCFVDRETNSDPLPKSFNGMSGGAIWRITVGADEKIKFNIAGVATEEGWGKNFTIDKIIFYGTDALYKSFYPFCLAHLLK